MSFLKFNNILTSSTLTQFREVMLAYTHMAFRKNAILSSSKTWKTYLNTEEYRINNDSYNDSNKGFTARTVIWLQNNSSNSNAANDDRKERGNMVIHGLHHLPASIIFLKGLSHSMSIDSVYLLPLSSV